MTDQKSNCILFQLLDSLFGKSTEQTTDASREPANTDQAINHSSQDQIDAANKPADENTNGMNTQHSDEERQRGHNLNPIPFFNRTEPSISWIGNAVALATAVGLFAFVDARINHLFEKRIVPYQELIRSMTLVDSNDHGKAIQYLDKAFSELTKDLKEVSPGDEYYYPAVDYYLTAITNSENPYSHQHRFGKILQLEKDNKYVFLGWHHHEIGWYYFRIDRLDLARKHFGYAKGYYESEDYFFEAAHTFWALTLVSLCDGDIDSAMTNYNEARSRDYSYHPDAALISLRNLEASDWYGLLVRLYDIEEYAPAFIERLENLES